MENNQSTEPNITQTVPFFWVQDMEASLKFYIEGLGFTIANQWTPRGKIEWCWLKRDAIAIMLQEARIKEPATVKPERPGKGVSICYQCKDALALYHEFTGKGIKIQEPFVGNNNWVVAFDDMVTGWILKALPMYPKKQNIRNGLNEGLYETSHLNLSDKILINRFKIVKLRAV